MSSTDVPEELPDVPLRALLDLARGSSTREHRFVAIEALVRLPLPANSWRDVESIMFSGLESTSSEPRIFDSAARVPSWTVREKMMDLIEAPDINKRALIDSLAKAGDRRTFPWLKDWLADPRPEWRALAARRIAALPQDAGAELWRLLHSDPDWTVRLIAAVGGAPGGDPPAVRQVLRDLVDLEARAELSLDEVDFAAAEVAEAGRPSAALLQAATSVSDATTSFAVQRITRALRRAAAGVGQVRSADVAVARALLEEHPLGDPPLHQPQTDNALLQGGADSLSTLTGYLFVRVADELIDPIEESPTNPLELGNRLIEVVEALGVGFQPEIWRFASLHGALTQHQYAARPEFMAMRRQLAWSAGRVGIAAVMEALGPNMALSAEQAAGAARFIRDTSDAMALPAPYLDGRPPEPPPRQVTAFLDRPTHRAKPPIPVIDPRTGRPYSDAQLILDQHAIPTPPRARRLIAGAWSSGRRLRRSLLPNTEHKLLVSIAIPKRGEAASPEQFPEHLVEDEGGGTTLEIEAFSEPIGLDTVAPVFLDTTDRTQPSTTATFTFTTEGEGSLVDIKLLLLHLGRPIQAGRYVATVRTTPIDNDRARLIAIPLSAAMEPRSFATAADVTLETDVRALRRVGAQPGLAVDLTEVTKMLDTVEGKASGILTAELPPSTLDDDNAIRLLIDLARWGHELRDHLSPLDLSGSRTIAVLVDSSSPIVPLELAYDGPAPARTAKLCRHATGQASPPPPGEHCTMASTRRVCPYAFWGLNRVIARTFAFAPGANVRRRDVGVLDLRPAVYAAAARADQGSNDEEAPSDFLERVLADVVGPAQLTRVTSWRAWRIAVRKSPCPQLLVVLGHTELAHGESTLEIGVHSRLARPDVSSAVIGPATPPPLVLLLACATASAGDPFGGLPAAFTRRGAAAVVATLSKLRGPHGAKAAAAVVEALRVSGSPGPLTLGAALTAARRRLVEDGFLIGLMLVAHGEIDLKVAG